MIVAITGGSGFIGRKLVERHLQQGDEVRLLTRRPRDVHPPGACIFTGDLRGGAGSLEPFADGADVLYHCAAEVAAEESMAEVNVAGTQKLCLAAAHRIGHWVQLGSIGVYDTRMTETVSEESVEAAVSTYERTKLAADHVVRDAGRNGWFSFTILRPSIVYGTDMPNRSLYALIELVARGFFFFIGRPGASANYIHIDNVVSALLLCAGSRQAKGRIYNLSDYRTLEDFVTTIAKHLGCRAPRLRLPAWLAMGAALLLGKVPGFPLTVSRVRALTGRTRFPSDRIYQELGYGHQVEMEQGLLEMVKAWQKMKGR